MSGRYRAAHKGKIVFNLKKCRAMVEKVFTQEQLDVLADMVLAEMGRLREFSNGRSEVVREALSDEIARLHTLYNYLIA